MPSLMLLQTRAPWRYALSRWRPLVGARATARLAVQPLQALGADVVHAHFGNVGWEMLPAVRAAGVPLVTSFYGRDVSERPAMDPRWRARYRELFRDGHRFLSEGPAMAAALVELGCPEAKIRIQRLGVDLARFGFRERRRADGEPLRVLAVGRFTEKKGFPDAVEAIAAAARTSDVRLTLVGGADGPRGASEADRIRESVRRHGVGDRVEFAGPLSLSRLAEVQARFHVVLQPSKRSSRGDTEGGAPVVLAELAAAGLPAVATRHADIPEVVIHERTGLLAEEGDVAGLAAHLVRLFHERDLLTTMSRAAAAHVRDRFDGGRCLEDLRRQYAGLQPS
jgi:colanic acid/amylovoran biosynthesis glycosyltransferase